MHYDSAFFERQTEESKESAELIAIVVQLVIRAQSLVDIGGGVGAFAAAFARQGVEDYLVVDGDYVERDRLLVPPEKFMPADLAQPLTLGRRFDLAVCLEVAEHLPASSSEVLIDTLDLASDVILFSAAVPGQTGTNHLNEQPQSHWQARFRERGYQTYDLVRPPLWWDDRVAWWYLQNTLVYARGAVAERLGPPSLGPVDALHPRFLRFREEMLTSRPEGLRHRVRRLLSR